MGVLLPALWPLNLMACPETLNFKMRELAGDAIIDLCQAYQGKVLLIVNTASKCGFTYQYEALVALYVKVPGPRVGRTGLAQQRFRRSGTG